jgi:hypothetical protein
LLANHPLPPPRGIRKDGRFFVRPLGFRDKPGMTDEGVPGMTEMSAWNDGELTRAILQVENLSKTRKTLRKSMLFSAVPRADCVI